MSTPEASRTPAPAVEIEVLYADGWKRERGWLKRLDDGGALWDNGLGRVHLPHGNWRDPAPQSPQPSAPLTLMYRDNGDAAWWSVVETPERCAFEDGQTFTFHPAAPAPQPSSTGGSQEPQAMDITQRDMRCPSGHADVRYTYAAMTHGTIWCEECGSRHELAIDGGIIGQILYQAWRSAQAPVVWRADSKLSGLSIERILSRYMLNACRYAVERIGSEKESRAGEKMDAAESELLRRYEAMSKTVQAVIEAQKVLAANIVPDGIGDHEAIGNLLEILDNRDLVIAINSLPAALKAATGEGR